MRVVLVGSHRARARLRAAVNGSLAIAGESSDLAAARASGIEADAFLVADDASESGPVRENAFIEALTDRERQVLDLLAEGLSNKRIAERLGISPQTAKFHVASIAGKLGARNRTQAVRLAVRQGLVTL
jgi:DNA-binding NarL/FixJ family response regulator